MKRLYTILFLVYTGLNLEVSGNAVKDITFSIFCDLERELKSDTSQIPSVTVDSFNLPILAPSSGIQFYRNGIVFLARSDNEVKMLSTHLSFGTIDTYYAVLDDSLPRKHNLFSPSVWFPYPSDAIVFSSDFEIMYFTKPSEKNGTAKIYQAKFSSHGSKKGKWIIDKTPLSFCMDNPNYTHPSLSADDRIMVFASDNTSSTGGMDLFISYKENGVWAEPENLGTAINTKGNEMYPCLDSANNLFFSSDGLPGLGGFDVFMCRCNGRGWEYPVNLTQIINSRQDEVAFTESRIDGKSAFFSSRKDSTAAAMQLFRVNFKGEHIANGAKNLSDFLYNKALANTDSKLATKVAYFWNEPELLPISRKNPEFFAIENTSKLQIRNLPVVNIKLPKIEDEIIENTDTLPHEKAIIIPESKVPPVVIKKEIPEPVVKSTEVKKEIPAPVVKLIEVKKEPVQNVPPEIKTEQKSIIYRVQVLSSMKSRGEGQISIDGKNYTIIEYVYKGEFRTAIGEFSTIEPAVELQNACRKSGYPEAFVIAFRNHERILDPSVFKRSPTNK
jgi:hypothetical protein